MGVVDLGHMEWQADVRSVLKFETILPKSFHAGFHAVSCRGRCTSITRAGILNEYSMNAGSIRTKWAEQHPATKRIA